MEDTYSNPKKYPEEVTPPLSEENFEDWLKKTKLSEKKLNILRLTHASATDDLASVTGLLQQQVMPTQICPEQVSSAAMCSDYIRYLGSSPFHWACSNKIRDLLCEQIPQPKIIDKNGFTPLMVCIIDNNLPGVIYWSAKDVYARENPFSVLKLALEKVGVFDYLVRYLPRIEDLDKVKQLETEANSIGASEKIRRSILRMRKDLTCLPHGGVPEEPKEHMGTPSSCGATRIMSQSRGTSSFFERVSKEYTPTQIIDYEPESQALELG